MPVLDWEELTPEQKSQVFVPWDGHEVPYANIEGVAQRMGKTPQAIMQLGTPGGKALSRIASTLPGRVALVAGQGLEDIAFTGLDIAAKLGVAPGIDRKRLEENRRREESFMQLITERGGDTEALLGETGTKFLDSAVRSGAKYGAAGIGGTAAVYGLVGAESANDAHNEALASGMVGGEALAYAGVKGAVDLGTTMIIGNYLQSKGLANLQLGVTPGMRTAAQRVAAKHGIPGVVSGVAKNLALSGAGEAVESAIQDTFYQTHQMVNGLRDNMDWSQIVESAASGFIAAAGTQGLFETNEHLENLNQKLKRMEPELKVAADATHDAGQFMAQATSEQIQDVLNAHDTLALRESVPKEIVPPKAFSKDYVEHFQAEVARQHAELRQDADLTAEVVARPDQDVNIRSVVEPTNINEAVELSSGTTTARTYQELQETAVRYGQDGYYSPGRTSQAMVDAEARKLEFHLPVNARTIADEVLATPGQLTPVKQEGLKIRLAEIEGEVLGHRDTLVNAESVGEIANRAAEMERLQNEGLHLINALQAGGTPAAQLLALRRTAQNNLYGPVGIIATAMSAKKGQLTAEERSAFTEDALELGAKNLLVEKAESKVREKTALEALKKTNERQSSSDLSELYARATALFQGGCDFA